MDGLSPIYNRLVVTVLLHIWNRAFQTKKYIYILTYNFFKEVSCICYFTVLITYYRTYCVWCLDIPCKSGLSQPWFVWKEIYVFEYFGGRGSKWIGMHFSSSAAKPALKWKRLIWTRSSWKGISGCPIRDACVMMVIEQPWLQNIIFSRNALQIITAGIPSS